MFIIYVVKENAKRSSSGNVLVCTLVCQTIQVRCPSAHETWTPRSGNDKRKLLNMGFLICEKTTFPAMQLSFIASFLDNSQKERKSLSQI